MYSVCNKIGEFVQWCKSPAEVVHATLPINQKITKIGRSVLDAVAPHGTLQRYVACNVLPNAVKYIGIPTATLIAFYYASLAEGHIASLDAEPWHTDDESLRHTIHDLAVGSAIVLPAGVLATLIAKDLRDKGKQALPDVLLKIVSAAATVGFLYTGWSIVLSIEDFDSVTEPPKNRLEDLCLIARAFPATFLGCAIESFILIGVGGTAWGLKEVYNHYSAKAKEDYTAWKEHETELVALEEAKTS